MENTDKKGTWRWIDAITHYQIKFQPSRKMSAAFRNEYSYFLVFYAVICSDKLRKITVPAKAAENSEILYND